MPAQFGPYLQSLIAARFESRREFIRASDPTFDEDTASGYVAKVVSGKRSAPLERIDAWANALALSGDERETFLRLAYLSHAPERVRQMMADLERRTAALEAAAEAVVRERDELRTENAALKSKISALERAKRRT